MDDQTRTERPCSTRSTTQTEPSRIGVREIATLGWLDADRAVVPELVALLRG
ncbi:hypothetical protein [Pseudonocardia sp. HH130630-07]|uniref:hypothetical protein n=1 Tax=Pseudonocardia sp. HH130630-07 TaxID=1690815 RepID=UPI0012E99D53|nr:hypothetical protein [Pseudonocardia sp. HH130630-07]